MPSFTQRNVDLTEKGPVIEIELARVKKLFPSSSANQSAVNHLKVLAMIDSGASGTVIRKGIAETLGLKPVGTTSMFTPSLMCSVNNFSCK